MTAVDSSLTLSESLVQEVAPHTPTYRSGKGLVCLSLLIGFCVAVLLKLEPYTSGWGVQRGGLHEPVIAMANLVQQRQALSRQLLPPAPFQHSFSQGLRNNAVAAATATDEETETKKKPKMMPYLRPRKPKIDINFFAATALNFVETHEYKVKPGMGPLFEKNFAARKTELFYLKGFQNFIVMRRVQAPQESDAFTYCVITSWKEQMYYDAWMQGKDSRNYMRRALTKGLTTGPEGHPTASNYFARSFFPSEPPSVRYLTGGPGSQMDFTGEKELEPQLFVSMRKYPDFESDDELVGTAESLKGAKGFRYAQILENPAGYNEAKQVLLSVWESKADYEASVLPKSKTPPLGEALYEGTLVLEQPRNF